MAQSNVGIRLTMDAGQFKSEANDLSNSIEGIRNKIKELQDAGKWQESAQLLIGLNNATSARAQIMAQARQAESEQARQLAQRQDPHGGMSAWIIQQAATQMSQGFIAAMNTAMSAKKMRASGDYTGAEVAYERGIGETIGGLGGAAAGVGLGAIISAITGLPPQITVPITSQIASSFGQFFGGVSAREKEENLAYSAQYKNALPGIDTLNQLYGGAINTKSADENNRYGMELRGRAVEAARGTGLDTDAFIEAMGRTASYGNLSFTAAADMTKNMALWSRFTGADLGTIQKHAGQAYRYGGETDATATAYAGLMAQGMGKGQLTEYLNSMERILEEGISKGFVRSTEEIAGNMALLYKLSGNNPLWQGEQGAQRYSQMNNALANATNLETVGDAISYSVVRDILNDGDRQANFYRMMNLDPKKEYEAELYTGTYLDEMMIMGRGVNGEILKGQYEYLKSKEGSNEAAIVEHLKNMNGLNDIGGVQLLRLMQRGESIGWESNEFEEQRKRITENVDYKSDSAKYQDMINALSNTSAKIGQIEFDNTEFKLLRESAVRLESILQERIKKYSGVPMMPPPDPMPGISEETMRTVGDRTIGKAATNTIMNYDGMPADSSGMDRFREMQNKYQEIISSYDPGVIGRSALITDYFANPSSPQSFPAMIADGEFTEKEASNTEKNLENLVRELDGINRSLQAISAREAGREEKDFHIFLP